jgi:ribosomal protein S18 acetylase RimI-like enzyme
VSSVDVRLFRRGDREQVTHLVNAHAAAVIPGVSVSVNTVMSQLEREPGEFVVEPWVIERATLVAEQRGRVVAAAHLLRYAAGDGVGEPYRDSGEIRWFLFWPEAPYWPDSKDAADALIAACVSHLETWGVSRQGADGALAVPGVYGVPEQWPHVRSAYEQAGFVHEGPTEVVLMANVDDLSQPSHAPLGGLTVARSVGVNGTRFAATLDAELVGYIEIASREDAGRLPRHGGWADIGNLHVAERHRRRGVGSWLVGQAAEWLQLARLDRVLDYARHDELDYQAFLHKVGFRELTRTKRGWRRDPRHG